MAHSKMTTAEKSLTSRLFFDEQKSFVAEPTIQVKLSIYRNGRTISSVRIGEHLTAVIESDIDSSPKLLESTLINTL